MILFALPLNIPMNLAPVRLVFCGTIFQPVLLMAATVVCTQILSALTLEEMAVYRQPLQQTFYRWAHDAPKEEERAVFNDALATVMLVDKIAAQAALF
jgi:hypothetical protein